MPQRSKTAQKPNAALVGGVLVLKRGRGRPRGSRKIDRDQLDLFPTEKYLAQFGLIGVKR